MIRIAFVIVALFLIGSGSAEHSVTSSLQSASRSSTSCPADWVCFAIDISSSIRPSFFDYQRAFAKRIANLIASRNHGSKFAAFGYNTVSMPLTTFGSSRVFSSMIDGVPSIRGSRSSSYFEGFKGCYEALVSRDGKRVIVFLTDGGDSGFPRAGREANFLRDSRIGVVTIGIGSGINTKELGKLATLKSAFGIVSGFSSLLSAAGSISKATCKLALLQPPAPANSCEKAEEKCSLKIRGARSIPEYNLGANGRFKTMNVITKFGSLKPDDLEVNMLKSFIIKESGGVFISSRGFRATSVRAPFAVKYEAPWPAAGRALRGKCIRIVFMLKRSSGTADQCLVLRIKA